MDDSWDELLRRLDAKGSKLGEQARLARQYVRSDPHASLNKARAILEKLLADLHAARIGPPPPKTKLDDLINNTQLQKFIPARLHARMKGIQVLGNLGTHLHDVTVTDAERAGDDLREIFEWHLGYAKLPRDNVVAIASSQPGAAGYEPPIRERLLQAEDPKMTVRMIEELQRNYGFQQEHFRKLHHLGAAASIRTHINYCRTTKRFAPDSNNVLVAERLAVCLQILEAGGHLPEAIATACRVHPRA